MVAPAPKPGDKLKAALAAKAAGASATKGYDPKAPRPAPSYGLGRSPARLFGTKGPHVTTGAVGRDSAGYSILKAFAVARGFIAPDMAKEEMETSERLKSLYESAGHCGHYGARSFYVPSGTNFLPTRHANGSEWSEMKAIAGELRQKMAATLPREVDFDEHSYVRQKTLGTLSDAAGGSLVASPQLGELIDLQRQFEAFSRAGATAVELPASGRIAFPKQSSGATAYWVGEGSPISESDLGTGSLTLEAKKLGVLSRFNNELLRFSSPQVEAMARTDFAAQLGLKADRAMFDGTGGAQIKGLLSYATQSAWSQGSDLVLAHAASTAGTDGDTFEPQDIYKMRHKLPDPVQAMPLTWVLNSTHAQTVMSRRAGAATATDGGGPFLFNITRDPNTGEPSGLYGGKFVQSQNVPQNREKGSATNLTLALLGYFGDWIIARSGVLEIEANPYETNAFAADQTLLRGIQRVDAGPRHLASFAVCDQLLVNG